MKKLIIAVATCIALAFCLTGCECNHKWEAASCEAPQTCEKCGLANGERDPEAHMWNAADCESPRTCARCGLADGEPNYENHAWDDATCLAPMTCWKCGETKGEAIGHKYDKGVCEVCGISDPNATKTSSDSNVSTSGNAANTETEQEKKPLLPSLSNPRSRLLQIQCRFNRI